MPLRRPRRHRPSAVRRAPAAAVAALVLVAAPPARADRTHISAALEVRPTPRLGGVVEHPAGGALRLEHALTLGAAIFPDAEVRTSAAWAPLGPVRPWLALRARRIDLEGLPPVETYAALGIGLASDPGRALSLAAGVGVRFQLPPLAAEPANDPATYAAENVTAELFFALRVRLGGSP